MGLWDHEPIELRLGGKTMFIHRKGGWVDDRRYEISEKLKSLAIAGNNNSFSVALFA
jgi:hypothetical protein